MTSKATDPAISGETRLYVFLGHPIAQARSPHLINPMFRERGIDAVMVAIDVAPADLDLAVAGFKVMTNIDGIVVTVPHKAAVMGHVDELRPTARAVGAVNVMRRESDGRWTGDILDGLGFVAGMRKQGHAPEGRSILLLGAGGAGAAVAHALAGSGIRKISIFDVDENRSRQLVERLTDLYDGLEAETSAPVPNGHDTVVNATPLGMKSGDPLPIDPEALTSGLLVVDVIMKPPVTPLLVAARNRGCRIHEGAHMLDGQIGEFIEFFIDRK